MKRFYQYPTCQDFSLSSKEKIKLVIRRHWIINYLHFFGWLFWGPICIGGILWIGNALEWTSHKNTQELIIAISLLYLIFVTFHFYTKWINDIFDVIFLTNDRVLDITQVDFWHRNIIETKLEYVQDATGDVKGLWNTLFDWGQIKIRTADGCLYSVDTVKNPHYKAREVFRLSNIARDEENKDIKKESEEVPKISETQTIKTPVESYSSIKKNLRNSVKDILIQKK